MGITLSLGFLSVVLELLAIFGALWGIKSKLAEISDSLKKIADRRTP